MHIRAVTISNMEHQEFCALRREKGEWERERERVRECVCVRKRVSVCECMRVCKSACVAVCVHEWVPGAVEGEHEINIFHPSIHFQFLTLY